MGSGKKPFCLAPRWIVWIVASGCGVMGCGNVRGELWFLWMSSGGGVGEFVTWGEQVRWIRAGEWSCAPWRELHGGEFVPWGVGMSGCESRALGIYDLRSRD